MPLIEERGPYGLRQSAPNLNRHHCDQSLRSTGSLGAKDERARLEHVRQRARIILRPRRDLGERHVLRRVDELAELAVCHWRAVDPKCADADPMRWGFLGIVYVRTHAEFAARDEDHIGDRIDLSRLDGLGKLCL